MKAACDTVYTHCSTTHLGLLRVCTAASQPRCPGQCQAPWRRQCTCRTNTQHTHGAIGTTTHDAPSAQNARGLQRTRAPHPTPSMSMVQPRRTQEIHCAPPPPHTHTRRLLQGRPSLPITYWATHARTTSVCRGGCGDQGRACPTGDPAVTHKAKVNIQHCMNTRK